MAMECGADAFVRHLKVDMSRPDSRPDLAAIRCPTTVLVGDTDQLTPPSLPRKWRVASMALGSS
jgi:pimeloyl-ACP methyl ester carboxylesterase